MLNAKIQHGGDPEFFISWDDQIVSAVGLFGGKKGAPHPLQNGSVQEDNIMLELNLTPASNRVEFKENISRLLKEIGGEVDKYGLALRLATPEIEMGEELSHQDEAMEFGCEPDFDAWTGLENDAPALGQTRWRFAGGHIHSSVDRILTLAEQRNIVKWYDVSVGLYCTLYDNGVRRAAHYGTAGRFRPTKYGDECSGIEYRVPSNFWVGTDHCDNIFLLANWAFKKGLANDFHDDTVGIEGIEYLVQDAINQHDTEVARYLFNRIMDIHAIADEV